MRTRTCGTAACPSQLMTSPASIPLGCVLVADSCRTRQVPHVSLSVHAPHGGSMHARCPIRTRRTWLARRAGSRPGPVLLQHPIVGSEQCAQQTIAFVLNDVGSSGSCGYPSASVSDVVSGACVGEDLGVNHCYRCSPSSFPLASSHSNSEHDVPCEHMSSFCVHRHRFECFVSEQVGSLVACCYYPIVWAAVALVLNMMPFSSTSHHATRRTCLLLALHTSVCVCSMFGVPQAFN